MNKLFSLLKAHPIKAAIGGLLLLAFGVVALLPRPVKQDGWSKEEYRRQLAEYHKLELRIGQLKRDSARLDSAYRVEVAATDKKRASYNDLVVTHKAQTNAHKALPPSAQHAANRRLLETYPGPANCKHCNDPLPKRKTNE
jgi:hypothetical protein